MLSGDVYPNLSFLLDMVDVSLELLDSPKPAQHNGSLARWASLSSHSLKKQLSFMDWKKYLRSQESLLNSQVNFVYIVSDHNNVVSGRFTDRAGLDRAL